MASTRQNDTLRAVLCAGAIALILALVYASPVLTAYLFNDEMNYFRAEGAGIVQEILYWSRFAGRPVAGPVMSLIHDALVMGEPGLQMLRVAGVVASVAGAIAAFALLRRLEIPHLHAALLVVFIWAQPAFAVYPAYVALMPYWIGIYAAFLSFALFHQRRDARLGPVEIISHAALLLIGFLTFQATPFMALPFLAAFTIGDADGRYRRRVLAYLAIVVGTTAAYTAGFRLASETLGIGVYSRANNLMEAEPELLAIGPGYLGPFEFWNYPFAVTLPEGLKGWLLVATLAAFAGMCIAAIAAEKAMKRPVLVRWSAVLACLLLSYLPIVASGGEGRQHIAIAVAATWILVAYSAARILLARRAAPLGPAVPALAAALVLWSAVGAGLGLERSIVATFGGFYETVETRLAAADGAVPEIVVRMPSEAPACRAEPCSGFFGLKVPGEWHASRARFFQFAAREAGLPGDTPVRFVTADDAPATAEGGVFIDWNALARPGG